MAAFSFADQARRLVDTAGGKSDSRRKMIMAVRAAARRLQLDDDDRRAVQVEVTGKASMADMDAGELGRVLDRFNRGWKGPSGERAHLGKIKALWWTLYWLGAAEKADDRAIDAFVKRQTGIASLRFLDARHAHSVIDALKGWAEREGVAWEPKPGELDDRRAVLAAIWLKLIRMAPIGNVARDAFVAGHLHIPADSAAWSRHEWDAAIRFLGKRLRKEQGRR